MSAPSESPLEPVSPALLAEAIRNAPAGATLHLSAGTFDETDPIRIEKPLTLTATDPRDPPRLRLHAPLELRADGVTLFNLILTGVWESTRPGEITDCTLLISCGSPRVEDCRIESEASSAVGITGNESQPTLLHCRVVGAKDNGILIADGARPVIEACEITGHSGVGLLATSGAEPVVRDCRIGDNGGNGVVVRDGGRGTFDRCEFFSNQMTNVAVANGAAVFRTCTVRDGAQGGVYVLRLRLKGEPTRHTTSPHGTQT